MIHEPSAYQRDTLTAIERHPVLGPTWPDVVHLELDGAVTADAVRGWLVDVVDRHEPLRTRFCEIEGRWKSVVDNGERFRFVQSELPDSTAEYEQALKDLPSCPTGYHELAFEAFAVRAGARLGLVLVPDHLTFDALSLEILMKEVGLLAAGARLPALATSYHDWVEKERTSLEAKSLEFWHKTFEAVSPFPLAELPTLRHRVPGHLPNAVQETLGVDCAVARSFEAVAAGSGLTPYAAYLTSLLVTYARLTGSTTNWGVNTVVGLRRTPAERTLIGSFINFVTLDLGRPSANFVDAADRVRTAVRLAYQHGTYPRSKLIRVLAPEYREVSINQPYVWFMGRRRFSELSVAVGHGRVGNARTVRLNPIRRYAGIAITALYGGKSTDLVCEFGEGEFSRDAAREVLAGMANVIHSIAARDLDVS